eukprot:422425_1
MSQLKGNWNKLQSAPFNQFSTPLILNNNEFILVTAKWINWKTCSTNKGDGIYKYNIQTNQWIKIFNYNEEFFCAAHGATLVTPNIYAYSWDCRLFAINLNNNKVETLSTTMPPSSFPIILNINGKLHVSGGASTRYNGHSIFDIENKSLNEIRQIDAALQVQSLLWIKSRHSIFLFGVKDNSLIMEEFSLCNNSWNRLNIYIPSNFTTHLFYYNAVTTKNVDYCFIFGGYDLDSGSYGDNISILEVKTMKFRNCNIKCPKEGTFHAVMVNNEYSDKLLSCGFINQCFNSSEFNNIQVLPHYLIKLIRTFVCTEFIHLLIEDEDGSHWKINVDDIICSML